MYQSVKSGVWAPDIFYNSDDHTFYLYYTANRQIGVATAGRLDGTFADRGILIKDAIDAHMFMDDDGEYYLYYAEYPVFRIYVQPMKRPLLKKGSPVLLIQPDEPWEKRNVPITEAPWMLKHNGTYYLLYSGGSAVYHQQMDETNGWNRIICIDPLRFDEEGVLHGKATRGLVQEAPAASAQ